jgi:outer membrane protein OmpA-like peptidoglycan-associated protein/ABC-type taurine transport system substrate-binding protein
MRDLLKQKGIRWTVQDDGADYDARIKALERGSIQMAVFTIDSFIAAGARLGEYPGTIVLVLDETKGADAMVAYKDAVPSIQALDHESARIVATPNSPSEFLARVVLAQFSLPRMPSKWLENADGAGAVFQKLRGADKNAKRAYVLWEPYVSRALDIDGVEVLLDSSRMSGYIVDVLVVQRRFLADYPDIVRDVVEAYLRASYSYNQGRSGLVKLVMDDAAQTGSDRLSTEQAERLVDGIQWKNTLENYAHFGLVSGNQAQGLQHVEDMIANITDVLVTTDALSSNPVAGKASTLFYDQIVRDLHAQEFHPGKKLNVIAGAGPGTQDLEAARGAANLRKLSDAEWERLIPVGEMRVPPIAFARGTSRLNVQSERELQFLAKRLQSLPGYYLTVVGHARAQGDADANLKLANDRAAAAAQALRENGLHANRIRAIAEPPSAANAAAQSVSFVVGQVPY